MADDEATARRTTKAGATGPAQKTAAKKTTAKKTAARKTAARKTAAPSEAAPAPKAAAKKTAGVGKAAAKKVPAKKAAPAPRKAGVKKAPAKRAGARDAGAVLAPRKKSPPPLRLAAEQTFDDDPWREPEPQPVHDDPSARVRGILRAAALSLEARERGTAPAAATPPPPPPPAAEEAVTRVLVSPPPPEPELEVDEAIEEDVLDDEVIEDDLAEPEVVEPEVVEEEVEEEDEWSPPEVLDEPAPRDAYTPPPPPPSEATTQVIGPPPARAPAPEKKKGRRGLRLLLVLLALVVVAGAVLAVLALRNEGIDYSELKVGDCFDSSQSNEVRGIDVKPCSEPHNSEIFFLVQHPAGPDDPYPGKDALVQFAADACLGQPLTEYLGVPLEQSSLKDFEIVPQESAWNDGRRVLVCGVDTGGGEDITGSVKGTRR